MKKLTISSLKSELPRVQGNIKSEGRDIKRDVGLCTEKLQALTTQALLSSGKDTHLRNRCH